jgi:hypothetical protein
MSVNLLGDIWSRQKFFVTLYYERTVCNLSKINTVLRRTKGSSQQELVIAEES